MTYNVLMRTLNPTHSLTHSEGFAVSQATNYSILVLNQIVIWIIKKFFKTYRSGPILLIFCRISGFGGGLLTKCSCVYMVMLLTDNLFTLLNWNFKDIFYCHNAVPSEPWHAWLGIRKSIQSSKIPHSCAESFPSGVVLLSSDTF